MKAKPISAIPAFENRQDVEKHIETLRAKTNEVVDLINAAIGPPEDVAEPVEEVEKPTAEAEPIPEKEPQGEEENKGEHLEE